MNFQLAPVVLTILIINIKNVQAILDGDIAGNDDFKYQIFFYSPLLCCCGGVIIDELHILTAGHCVYNIAANMIIVFAGVRHLGDFNALHPKIKKIHYPRNYLHGAQHDKNDIAVLTLDGPLSLGQGCEAIPLPEADNIHALQTCKFSGWGPTKPNDPNFTWSLTWYSPTILTPAYCTTLGGSHENNEFCVLDLVEVSTPLEGDSGGGLECSGVLAGILTTGASSPGIPAVFIKVHSFLSFIREVREKDQEEEEEKRKNRKRKMTKIITEPSTKRSFYDRSFYRSSS